MIGWLQCAAGISGDMLLGALVDAGVPLDVIDEAVQRVTPEPVRLRAERTIRAEVAATKVFVEAEDSSTHRTWADVRSVLESTEFAGRDQALATFEKLALAEGKVHGTEPDRIHFHEVGALDAIADVVGACAGMTHLGLDRLICSPIALGGGTVHAAHGHLAVPGPAVVEILAGVPTYGGPVAQELATPTGAALATTWADDWGDQPIMRVTAQGFGAGSRDFTDRANVLRLLLGEAFTVSTSPEPDTRVIVETNVDDLDNRLWPSVLTALLAAGAEDAWLVPIVMKKGRPAYTLRVLTAAHRLAHLSAIIFRETSAIGLRTHDVAKMALHRAVSTVDVGGQPVRIKLALLDGEVVNAQPEWDDVSSAAKALGEAAKSVLHRAMASYLDSGTVRTQ